MITCTQETADFQFCGQFLLIYEDDDQHVTLSSFLYLHNGCNIGLRNANL